MKIRNYTLFMLLLASILWHTSVQAQGNCQQDTIAPVAVCQNGIVFDLPPSGPVTIFAEDVNVQSWDDCTSPDNLDLRITLDANSSVPPPEGNMVELGEIGVYLVVMWVGDEAGNWSNCWVQIVVQSVTYIEVTVYQDTDNDCEQDGDEAGIANWPVQSANPILGTQTHYTDANGVVLIPIYDVDSLGNSNIDVDILLANGVSTGCQTTYTFSSPFGNDLSADFGIQLVKDCNALFVDISTFRLRPCLPSYYTVNYCNYRDQTVSDAVVTVTLDPVISLESASVPFTDLGNDTYSFAVGDIAAGSCGTISLGVLVSCDAELGSTKCGTATIEPYDCDDPTGSYTGASLQVTGECDENDQLVRFQITNVGQSDMTEPLSYAVVEDVVMYMEAPVLLQSQQTLELPALPANGATWRISIPQPDGHPGLDAPTVFVEGCGGLNPGLVNQFSLNDADPNISIDCQVVTGSYDPNDKQAFPTGYGEEHFIEPGTDIEYLIRFQNTGTDTAFNVVVRDELDPLLDYTSLRAGASSHPYRMELAEAGQLAFYFDNIMLPDSNISEINSHGFIKFRIAQKEGNALGNVIENTAAIYFDFNEPVITNTVFHTLGERFITANRPEPFLPGVDLTIAPNPFREQAQFTLNGYEAQRGRLLLYDQWGRLVRQQAFAGSTFRFDRHQLSSGLYVYMVQDGGTMVARGRLVVQ